MLYVDSWVDFLNKISDISEGVILGIEIQQADGTMIDRLVWISESRVSVENKLVVFDRKTVEHDSVFLKSFVDGPMKIFGIYKNHTKKNKELELSEETDTAVCAYTISVDYNGMKVFKEGLECEWEFTPNSLI